MGAKAKSKAATKANANILKVPAKVDDLNLKKDIDRESENLGTKKELKRRGRKRERDDVYFVKGNNKINDLRE